MTSPFNENDSSFLLVFNTCLLSIRNKYKVDNGLRSLRNGGDTNLAARWRLAQQNMQNKRRVSTPDPKFCTAAPWSFSSTFYSAVFIWLEIWYLWPKIVGFREFESPKCNLIIDAILESTFWAQLNRVVRDVVLPQLIWTLASLACSLCVYAK